MEVDVDPGLEGVGRVSVWVVVKPLRQFGTFAGQDRIVDVVVVSVVEGLRGGRFGVGVAVLIMVDRTSVFVVTDPIGQFGTLGGHDRIVEIVVVKIVEVSRSGSVVVGDGVVTGHTVVDRRMVFVVRDPTGQPVTVGAQDKIGEMTVVNMVEVVKSGVDWGSDSVVMGHTVVERTIVSVVASPSVHPVTSGAHEVTVPVTVVNIVEVVNECVSEKSGPTKDERLDGVEMGSTKDMESDGKLIDGEEVGNTKDTELEDPVADGVEMGRPKDIVSVGGLSGLRVKKVVPGDSVGITDTCLAVALNDHQ